MDDSSNNSVLGRLSFLGESPYAWMIFLAAVVVWLWLWGRVINFLGIDEG